MPGLTAESAPAAGEEALTEEGELRGDTEAFLRVFTDLLLSNAGATNEVQLFRNVLLVYWRARGSIRF